MNKEEQEHAEYLKEQEKEFLDSRPDYFHLTMLRYVSMHQNYDNDGQLQDIMDNNKVIQLEFPEGKWTIRWDDLVERANEELERFKEENPEIEFDEFYENIDNGENSI